MNAALRQLYFGDGQFYELSPDDDFQFDFDDSLFDAAAREILDNGGYTPDYLTTPTGSALINETNRAFTDAISKGLGEQPDPAVAAALRENAFIFSGFKTHAELEQVAQLLTDENGNIRPFNEFLNDVQKLNKDYNHTYLRTEYNQAVQAAQMASKWADFERDKDFINLQYRTANDERVRASHRILHGVTLPVDDKFWQQYTPPNGWGCRCTVVAVPKDDADYPVKDVHGSTIDGKEVFPTPAYEIFKTNTAKDRKVFPDKHPYLPKSCATCPLNTEKTLSRKDVKRDCSICDTRKKHFEWKGKGEWSNMTPAPKFVMDEEKYKELTKHYDTRVSLKEIQKTSFEKFDAVRLLQIIDDGVKYIADEKLIKAWNKTKRSIVKTQEGKIELLISANGFRLFIDFEPCKDAVTNRFIDIEPKKRGMGSVISLELLKQYQTMGITKVMVCSTLQAGGYTWARTGYYAVNREEAENVIQTWFQGKDVEDAMCIVDRYYTKGKTSDHEPFPMQKIALKKYQPYLVGSSWNAVLNPQNHQCKGMIRYLRRKLKEIEKRKYNEPNAIPSPEA